MNDTYCLKRNDSTMWFTPAKDYFPSTVLFRQLDKRKEVFKEQLQLKDTRSIRSQKVQGFKYYEFIFETPRMHHPDMIYP